MKNRLVGLTILILALQFNPSQSYASLIGSFEIGGSSTGSTTTTTPFPDTFNVLISFLDRDYLDAPSSWFTVFDFEASTSDAGRRFSVTEGGAFDGAISLLTNGDDNNIYLESFGSGGSERKLFRNLDNSPWPDALGWTIVSIDFVLSENFSYTTGRNTSGGYFYHANYTGSRLEIHAVPLPTAFILMLSGLFFLRKRLSCN